MLSLILMFAPLPKKPLSPAPVLGYNTWNAFRGDINEEKVKRTADLMVEKGLLAAGYNYLIIDDGYLLSNRDADGKIIIDSNKFPSGMKAVADYIHSKGLKFGMYNSAGTGTCMGLAGSFGVEDVDANTFAEFGIDFLKYDFCNNPLMGKYYGPDLFSVTVNGKRYQGNSAALVGSARLGNQKQITYIGNNDGEAEFMVSVATEGIYDIEIEYASGDNYRVMMFQVNDDESQIFLAPNTGGYSADNTATQTFKVVLKKGGNQIRFFMDLDNTGLDHYSYIRMADELILTGRDIVFAVCEWGSNQPYKWAQDVGHLWRTSLDITAITGTCYFSDVITNYDTTIGLYKYAGENAYNDPDMLCIGLKGLSQDENIAHMSLWAVTASPLLIGADLDLISNESLDLLKHKDMLAINQDGRYKQGIPAFHTSNFDILVKEMVDGQAAICFFNRLSNSQNISFDLKEVEMYLDDPSMWQNAKKFVGKDIWTGSVVDLTADNSKLVRQVPGHGAYLFVIKPQ